MRSHILLPLCLLLASAACDAEPGDEPAIEATDTSAAVSGPAPIAGVIDTAGAATAGADSTEAGAQPSLSGGAIPPSGGGSPAVEQPAQARPPVGAPLEAAPSGEGATPVTTDEAREVLLRAERAYDGVRSLRAEFIQDLTVPLLGSSQRSRGQIFHRKPDRFLMRFSDPAGDVVVADGSHVWLYYPSTDPKQVIRTSIGQAGRLDLQREFLSNPTERFEATLDGRESVDGRPARALTLVPRGPSPYRRVRIWVDDRDGLVRRFEITESNDNVRRVELRGLEANATLADDLFTFTPPAGTEVFDQ
jgi:outer membrane lipoprotein carrier protein